MVVSAQQAGWEVCLVATREAMKFIDHASLEVLTGYPVRSEYKHPDEPDVLPPPDAMIVAPATCNTINKWAAGIGRMSRVPWNFGGGPMIIRLRSWSDDDGRC